MKHGELCINRAPHIFYISGGYAHIAQGCCNNWQCPRCGLIRAKQEYYRMVSGIEQLYKDGHDLYFITLTCRGREMSVDEAEQNYYKWTTTILNACRNRQNRAGLHWAYVQVTERQKRQHPRPKNIQ